MKAQDLRAMETDALNKELHSVEKEFFNLRVQKVTGQSPKTHLFKQAKRTIARIKTILNEKKG